MRWDGRFHRATCARLSYRTVTPPRPRQARQHAPSGRDLRPATTSLGLLRLGGQRLVQPPELVPEQLPGGRRGTTPSPVSSLTATTWALVCRHAPISSAIRPASSACAGCPGHPRRPCHPGAAVVQDCRQPGADPVDQQPQRAVAKAGLPGPWSPAVCHQATRRARCAATRAAQSGSLRPPRPRAAKSVTSGSPASRSSARSDLLERLRASTSTRRVPPRPFCRPFEAERAVRTASPSPTQPHPPEAAAPLEAPAPTARDGPRTGHRRDRVPP